MEHSAIEEKESVVTPPSPASPPLYEPVSGLASNFKLGNYVESVHVVPSLMVCGGAFTVVFLMNIFLHRTKVLSASDHAAVFVTGSYICYSSYFLVYYYLNEYAPSFRRLSKDKQFYAISNLLKSGVLAAITPFCVVVFYHVVVSDEWDSNTLKNLGCIYAVPDFVSLFVVRRMTWSTIVHHVVVCVLNVVSIYNDYSEENVCRVIAIYAAFSTLGFVVYVFLASRFLGLPKMISNALSCWAFINFVVCCAANWFFQIYFLYRLVAYHNHWSIYLYTTGILWVAYDDINLSLWLWNNVRSIVSYGCAVAAPSAVEEHGIEAGSRMVASGSSPCLTPASSSGSTLVRRPMTMQQMSA